VLGGLMGRAETENAILRSLTRVGPAKPVAYLPLHTIRIILQMDPQALAQDAELNGLGAALFGPDRCCIKSGALYIFDRQSLENLIRLSKSILLASGWPLDPDHFVARIAREWIDHAHPVASVIKRAFGEQA
jgi:hypothetical protein